MKHFTSFLAFFSLFQTVFAQAIVPDAGFGQNGRMRTLLSSHPNNYTALWDINSNGEITVFPEGTYKSMPFFSKYSMQGDSLETMDYPYDDNAASYINTVMTLAEGRFLLASMDTTGLIMFRADGTRDSTFGVNGKAKTYYNRINEICLGRNDRIYTAGMDLNGFGVLPKGGNIIAYTLNGQIDSTFGNNGLFVYPTNKYIFFNRMLQQSDGKLVVAGCILDTITGMFNLTLRVLPNGQPDLSFGTNGVILEKYNKGGENYGLVIQPDGKIVVGGNDYTQKSGVLFRYMPDGTRDPSFGNNGFVELPMMLELTDMQLLPNEKILLYGSGYNTQYYSALVQLLPNGTLDPYFGMGGTYFGPTIGLRPPLRMRLISETQLIAAGTYNLQIPGIWGYNLQFEAFTLDLHVGTVSPEEKPSVWTYPNPVSDAVAVKFNLKQTATLQFELYDLQGNLLQTPVGKTTFDSGEHTQNLSLQNLTAGNYFLRLTSDGKPLAIVRITKI